MAAGHSQPGERNGRAKLTEVQVDEIRKLYATGEHTLRELAPRFGVSYQTVWLLCRAGAWRKDPLPAQPRNRSR